MANPEAKLTLKIRKALEAKGCYVAKIHGNQFSVGIPDLLVCYRGMFFGMEVKNPGKEKNVTQLQQNNLDRIKKAGGEAHVVTSVEQALEIVSEDDN